MASCSDQSRYGSSILLLDITTRAQKRWRVAYLKIYATRLFMLSSLPKEIVSVSPKNLTKILNSQPPPYSPQPFTALNVQPDTTLTNDDQECGGTGSMLNAVDHVGLVEMVKGKNLETLPGLGGVGSIAAILSINPKNGIPDDGQAVIKRRQIFGPNTYTKPPPKSFLFFAADAFKCWSITLYADMERELDMFK